MIQCNTIHIVSRLNSISRSTFRWCFWFGFWLWFGLWFWFGFWFRLRFGLWFRFWFRLRFRFGLWFRLRFRFGLWFRLRLWILFFYICYIFNFRIFWRLLLFHWSI